MSEGLDKHAAMAETIGLGDTVASGGVGTAPAPAPRGALIGRYMVISQLGTGAMGVVFAAFDPELDRKVALKLLKHRGGDLGRSRERLQREAQSLAKLDHPNVVSVFDVGVHREQLFVEPGRSAHPHRFRGQHRPHLERGWVGRPAPPGGSHERPPTRGVEPGRAADPHHLLGQHGAHLERGRVWRAAPPGGSHERRPTRGVELGRTADPHRLLG